MTGLTPEEVAAYDQLVGKVREGRTVALDLAAPQRGKPPSHWADLDAAGRRQAVVDAGMPAFRADQIDRHLFEKLDLDPQHWTDLPKADRHTVAERFLPDLLQRVRDQQADRGTTVKTLWRAHDHSLVESVLMRYGVPGIRSSGRGRLRATVCISSQAGCGMACPFCATGQGGLRRNLSTAEILAQVIDAARMLRDGELPGGPGRINNIVFMGMGEPMANYSRVLNAIRTIIAPPPHGLGISARGVTVSTVGLVPQIRRLAGEGIPVTLAVSLHAPDDGLRDQLCPINTRFKVAELIAAAHDYFSATGRRVSIEYALIRDINDHPWRAEALADLLHAAGGSKGPGWAHVNPIPLNPTPGSIWTASDREVQDEFVRRLTRRGVTATVRDTRGSDIDGACGQLAAAEN